MKPALALIAAALASLPAAATPLPTTVDVNRPGLTPARKSMMKELAEVIPSVQGMKKSKGRNLFDGTTQLTPTKVAQLQAAKQPIATTCGLLPGVMLKHLGISGMLSVGGTEGLRICGQGLGGGVYQESDGKKLPKPGDLYWLRYPATPGIDSVAHVGVIYEIRGDTWITADAGQGSLVNQEAKLVVRQMKKVDGVHPFLSGPQNTPGDSSSFRRIGGWIDLDKLLEPATMKRAAALKFVQKGWTATCK